MRIEFELLDKNNVNIMGIEGEERKTIGQIFTPSGSGRTNLNAIQVCGFKEAFDLWGCWVFDYNKDEDKRLKVVNRLKEKKDRYIHAKDIQLLFSFETGISHNNLGCPACYNNPCTCENTCTTCREGKINPYNLKREYQLKEELETDKP